MCWWVPGTQYLSPCWHVNALCVDRIVNVLCVDRIVSILCDRIVSILCVDRICGRQYLNSSKCVDRIHGTLEFLLTCLHFVFNKIVNFVCVDRIRGMQYMNSFWLADVMCVVRIYGTQYWSPCWLLMFCGTAGFVVYAAVQESLLAGQCFLCWQDLQRTVPVDSVDRIHDTHYWSPLTG